MNFIIRISLLSCIFIEPSQAQVITFERTYGGKSADQGYSAVQTGDGGYIVAGYTGSFGAGGDDAFILKTDAFGDSLWSKTYGGSNDDALLCVEQTSDNGFIFCGSYTNALFERIAYLIKTDENGDSTWTRKYRLSDYCILQSLEQTSDDGFIIVGYGTEMGDGIIYLLKTDAFGDTLWVKEFGGPSLEFVGSVTQTNDNGYAIVGTTYSFGSGYSDVYLIKTDINGDTAWTNTYGGALDDVGQSFQQTTDGGYIIMGWTLNFGDNDGREDYYLIKTDSNGNELWYKTFESYDFNQGFSVIQTSDGGYALAGWTWNAGNNLDRSIYLVKTNSVGDIIREKLIDSTNTYHEYAFDIKETSDKGLIITGSELSPGTGNSNRVYLLKTDSTFNFTSTGVSNEIDERKVQVSIRPNPFSKYSTIHIQNAQNKKGMGNLHLQLYDVLGRSKEVVADVIQKSQSLSEIKLYRGSLLPGIYFCTIMNKSKIISTTKIIIR